MAYIKYSWCCRKEKPLFWLFSNRKYISRPRKISNYQTYFYSGCTTFLWTKCENAYWSTYSQLLLLLSVGMYWFLIVLLIAVFWITMIAYFQASIGYSCRFLFGASTFFAHLWIGLFVFLWLSCRFMYPGYQSLVKYMFCKYNICICGIPIIFLNVIILWANILKFVFKF